MKILKILILLPVIMHFNLYGQTGNSELTIIIKNLRSNDGLVGVQLLDENGKEIKGMYVSIKKNIAETKLSNLPKAKYAVRVYHDENQNDKMDLNWFRIPKEGFGFSGSANGNLGSPDIQDMLISLDKDKQITINIIYIL